MLSCGFVCGAGDQTKDNLSSSCTPFSIVISFSSLRFHYTYAKLFTWVNTFNIHYENKKFENVLKWEFGSKTHKNMLSSLLPLEKYPSEEKHLPMRYE